MQQDIGNPNAGAFAIDRSRSAALDLRVDWQKRFRIIRYPLAALLLVGAVLKTLQLINGVYHTVLSNSSELGVVIGESILALWLLSGVLTRFAWLASIVTFTGFAFYSAISLYTHHISCGCFGAVTLHPQSALIINLTVILLLLTTGPPVSSRPITLARTFGIGFAIVGIFFFSANGGVRAIYGKQITQLRIEDWIGQRLPILDQIDIAHELSTGEWLVLFFHHDCGNCMQAALELAAANKGITSANSPKTLAFIEVPPFGPLAGC
jgi:hypothetical protein